MSGQDILSETKALGGSVLETSLSYNIAFGPVTFNLVPKHTIVKIHFLSWQSVDSEPACASGQLEGERPIDWALLPLVENQAFRKHTLTFPFPFSFLFQIKCHKMT